MKILHKLVGLGMATLTIFVAIIPAYSVGKADKNAVQDIEVLEEKAHTEISYTERREDGTYYILESFDGISVTSKIYKIDNGKRSLNSTIDSEIHNGYVLCVEEKENGEVEKYQVKVIKDSLLEQSKHLLEKQQPLLVATSKKTYLRTEKYGISLVGKKATIAIAAAAIVAATAYVNFPVAVKIVTAAIAAGAGAGAASLPDYLYVTSKVYTTHSSGKIYTRYENSYYLDSARTKYVGSWTFSKRWGH